MAKDKANARQAEGLTDKSMFYSKAQKDPMLLLVMPSRNECNLAPAVVPAIVPADWLEM